jgi:DNA repair exonuclease SbcCD ATPase subunit
MANLTITERVLAFLNITDAGKINNFYLKQQSQLNKDIKNLNKNLDTLNDQYDERVEELEEKLDDARIRVEEAYQGVTPEDVATNEKAASFADKYWDAIERAEEVVADLEISLQIANEKHTASIDSVNKQIAERQRRLSRLA